MNIKFKFALSPEEPALTSESNCWSTPLPASRHAFNRKRHEPADEADVTYGDYFTAARHFLSKDGFALLCDAAGQCSGRRVAPTDIEQVAVYLVKHGAFYHPAYVITSLRNHKLPFVLNAAASPEGRKLMDKEYHNLVRLNTQLTSRFWPQLFGMGEGVDGRGRSMPMFLGQWFEGFYEFHLSGETTKERYAVIWDTRNGHRRLNKTQVRECMRQAGRILAYAYNPWTFEAIRNWHHAAGDFVMALNGDEIALRLITVRDYAPLLANGAPDVAAMLEALLVLWVEISLKLRLDRLDGIGEMVCYNIDIVPSISKGFFQGVRVAASERGLPEGFEDSVKAFAALHDVDQLNSIAATIIERISNAHGERGLLKHNLKDHLRALRSAVDD